MSLQERDSKVIWHPFTQVATSALPIGITRAEGCWLFAEDGKKYLDATASWWVNAHGHAHPYIAKRIYEQAQKLEHIIFAGFTHEPAVELAEKLIELLPGNQSRIFYSDNGSTSVEVALKMALQYFYNTGERRKKIIAFRNAYHGDTFGAMAVAERNAFSAPFNDYLFEVEFIDAPESDLVDSESQLLAQLELGDVAAFIFEPLVQGANGMRMHSAERLSNMIAECRKHGVISIADEVFTGFYRTARPFACSHLENQPDIMCLSKTLTGGTLPLGVTAAPEFIYEAFISEEKRKTFFHGHSFTANPISCTAALASLELLKLDETLANIEEIEIQHQNFLNEVLNHPSVFEARHLGCILAIELKTSKERGYLNPAAAEITQYFLNKEIYLRPLGNVLYVTPPYTIKKEELQMIYVAILQFLESYTIN
ncbi:MAG: adenosylmethionine--8-amino-7-oxononanoate transaminase [Bacteroidia bacterium]